MSKQHAIVLIMVMNTLLTLGLGFAALVVVGILFGLGLGLMVIVLGLHITGAMYAQLVCQKHKLLSPLQFWLFAAAPAVVLSAWGLILVLYLDSISYFTGFFAGLGEFIFALCELVYAGAFLVVLGVALLIKSLIRRKHTKKEPEK